jgi:hypothetical protein
MSRNSTIAKSAPAAMLTATMASNTNEASTITIPPEMASPFLPYGLFRGEARNPLSFREITQQADRQSPVD